jgi:FMN phosphatase YigB (HAD superfamily)
VFAGPEITRHVLDALGVTMAAARVDQLVRVLEDEMADHRIVAAEGAGALLSALRDDGVRVALICDTGFSPGRVVRQLLERVGLLQHLEVQIFSDEIGVPKPHPHAFHAALRGLGVEPQRAVHVGDLRRSDIAGARDVGMTSARYTGLSNDGDVHAGASGAGVIDCMGAGCDPPCPRPEADVVVNSHADLTTWLARTTE